MGDGAIVEKKKNSSPKKLSNPLGEISMDRNNRKTAMNFKSNEINPSQGKVMMKILENDNNSSNEKFYTPRSASIFK